MAEILKIGKVQLDVDDLPEGVDLGGDAMLAILKFPGGYREVQSFGTQDRDIHFTGQLNYTSVDKVDALNDLYQSGFPQNVWIGPWNRICVIAKFYWTYISSAVIQYDITLTPSPQYTILAPAAATSSSSSSSSTPSSSPSNVSPAPQKTYVVKSGDTLIAIAKRFYNDATQYRKIATANKISNPNLIQIGQKLVIP